MKTVYVTWVYDGVEETTDVHEFACETEYEQFCEEHWRGTSTTSPEMFEQMTADEQQMVQSLWEEIED